MSKPIVMSLLTEFHDKMNQLHQAHSFLHALLQGVASESADPALLTQFPSGFAFFANALDDALSDAASDLRLVSAIAEQLSPQLKLVRSA